MLVVGIELGPRKCFAGKRTRGFDVSGEPNQHRMFLAVCMGNLLKSGDWA